MAKITYFHVARQVGWLVAGLLIIALDPIGIHAAVAFPGDRPSLTSAMGDRPIELAAEMTPIAPSGPDQSGEAPTSAPINDARADARLKQCKLQWTAADMDG